MHSCVEKRNVDARTAASSMKWRFPVALWRTSSCVIQAEFLLHCFHSHICMCGSRPDRTKHCPELKDIIRYHQKRNWKALPLTVKKRAGLQAVRPALTWCSSRPVAPHLAAEHAERLAQRAICLWI